MSNAKTYQGDTAAIPMHYISGSLRMVVCHYVFCSCGRKKRAATDARCLRCCTLLDREFQRKARRWFASTQGREARRMLMLCGAGPSPLSVYPFDAARAIAREEGRTL